MASHPAEYDSFAELYELWASVDPAFSASHDFYLNLCLETNGKIVELGVGTGRIAIDVAKAGKQITGVDISSAMLDICRQRAEAAGVLERIELVHGDIQDFSLAIPADLVLIPFRSLGHILTLQNKRKALQNIYQQLAPGGRLVFDHYVFHEDWARNHDGYQRLMYSGANPAGENLVLWDTYLYYFSTQQISGVITVERTNSQGLVIQRAHHPIHESWITPAQVRDLAASVGFTLEAAYGDFACSGLSEESTEQVWMLRKPG